MVGQLILINSGQYTIKSNGEIYIVKGAGKLRHKNITPMVGDIVDFTPNEFLTNVHERKNYLIRPKVSNIDQVLIVTSLVEPNYSSFLLNKFLAIIENRNIKPVIIFTKKDLTNETHLEEYTKQGYVAYEIDNITKNGIDDLKGIFKNKISVFTGQSGAGKSTTINSISGFNLQTNIISKSLGRGKHTTRLVTIYDWMGGQIIDTPGFSSLEFDMNKLELARSYHDFRKASRKCKFPRTCIHFKEEVCEVKTMVEEGKITTVRYNDYLRLLKEAR